MYNIFIIFHKWYKEFTHIKMHKLYVYIYIYIYIYIYTHIYIIYYTNGLTIGVIYQAVIIHFP